MTKEELELELQALRAQVATMQSNQVRSLCGNCGHWREEHYTKTGIWRGQEFGCFEYYGTEPDQERLSRKAQELVTVAPQPKYAVTR